MKKESFILHGYGVIFVVFAGFLAYGALFRWLDRRCELSASLRLQLNRFAPAFLIFTPPIITYGFVCGFLSLSYGVFCDRFFIERISNRESFYLPVFHALEYVSGVGMGYVWIRFVRWLGLPPLWYLLIVTSHGLVAGYREARSDFGGNVFGPTVTDHFVIVDGLIPFLALFVYGLLHSDLIRRGSR
jgi:hypothetical protein